MLKVVKVVPDSSFWVFYVFIGVFLGRELNHNRFDEIENINELNSNYVV